MQCAGGDILRMKILTAEDRDPEVLLTSTAGNLKKSFVLYFDRLILKSVDFILSFNN